MNRQTTHKNSSERGNAILEFACVAPFMVLALIGIVSIGFMLGRSLQVVQVTRDAGHMFFDGVDFSVLANQKIVGRLGYGMGIAADGQGTINASGDGVVILTKIIKVGANECAIGGFNNVNQCPNYNQLVIEKRVVIGNSSLRTSSFGAPINSLLQPDGSILPASYCTQSSVLVPASSAPTNLNLLGGQYTYGVESFFRAPALTGFLAHDAYSFILM